MRLLAFDFGTAHIGVACGNDETGTVEALGALRARDGRPDERDLMRLKEQWQPQHLVVGLPLMADGSTQG